MSRTANAEMEIVDPFADDPVRPRVDVIGLTVEDVVAHAGGWMCDRGLAGWDVRAAVLQDGDETPLRIVGVGGPGRDPRSWSTRPVRGRGLRHAVAISAQALARDADTQDVVRRIVRRGWIDVLLWGEGADRFNPTGDPQRYVMSCAAAAFKSRACASSAWESTRTGAVEDFYALGRSCVDTTTHVRASVRSVSSGLRQGRV